MSAPPAPPLVLASTSPQRRAILEQLGLPFEVVAPEYDEEGVSGANPVALVGERARGKARSIAGQADERPIVGVDTAVVLAGEIFGKPANAGDAERMLERLAGKTHVVVSGLCVVTPAWEELVHDGTRVSFRRLTPRDRDVSGMAR